MHTFIVNNVVVRVLHITTKQSINAQNKPLCTVGEGLAPPEKKDKINLTTNAQNPLYHRRGGVSPPDYILYFRVTLNENFCRVILSGA